MVDTSRAGPALLATSVGACADQLRATALRRYDPDPEALPGEPIQRHPPDVPSLARDPQLPVHVHLHPHDALAAGVVEPEAELAPVLAARRGRLRRLLRLAALALRRRVLQAEDVDAARVVGRVYDVAARPVGARGLGARRHRVADLLDLAVAVDAQELEP